MDHEENAKVKVVATDNSGVQATTNLPECRIEMMFILCV